VPTNRNCDEPFNSAKLIDVVIGCGTPAESVAVPTSVNVGAVEGAPAKLSRQILPSKSPPYTRNAVLLID
jgi:hypothetical protein